MIDRRDSILKGRGEEEGPSFFPIFQLVHFGPADGMWVYEETEI